LATKSLSASLPIKPALSAPSVATTPDRIELIRIFVPQNSFDSEMVIASGAALVWQLFRSGFVVINSQFAINS